MRDPVNRSRRRNIGKYIWWMILSPEFIVAAIAQFPLVRITHQLGMQDSRLTMMGLVVVVYALGGLVRKLFKLPSVFRD